MRFRETAAGLEEAVIILATLGRTGIKKMLPDSAASGV
jgi:hypothetical protein